MPNRLPIKPRAKAIQAPKLARARERAHAGAVDWFALWAISLGLAAMAMACIAYFTAGDKVGASLVLGGTAALMAVLLTANERGYL